MAGTLRRIDEPDSNRLFSFIVHLERLRGAHADQHVIAQRLIERLRVADLTAGGIAGQVRTAYQDLSDSRSAAKMYTPPLKGLLPRIRAAFAGITTEVVNADSQLEQLLDDSGQLRQESPFNIYIGGQSLDRGVTIANVIGFFYGRNPRVAQQDTTIQHCRMYGNRPKGDLAVTRFYTSNTIYARMSRMHDFDKMLWDQLTAKEDHGESVDNPGDVTFLQRDPTGAISHCSANKILLSRAQWVRPGGELVPRPFKVINDKASASAVERIKRRLQSLGKPSKPFQRRANCWI